MKEANTEHLLCSSVSFGIRNNRRGSKCQKCWKISLGEARDEGVFRVPSTQSRFFRTQAHRTLTILRGPWRESPWPFPLLGPILSKHHSAPKRGVGTDKGQVDETQRPRPCASSPLPICALGVTPVPHWARLILTYKMIGLSSESPVPLRDPLTSQRAGILLAF